VKKPKPLVSIITVCLNAEETIRRTIESVISQSYGNLEYIIIDGGSTDGTIDIVKEYADNVNIFITEKDNGISDGFNKGIDCSSGEFIKLLNADDYMPPEFIDLTVEVLQQHTEAAFVFGDVVRIDSDGIPTVYLKGDANFASKLDFWSPQFNHPTFLVRRSIYVRYGPFDASFRSAMDLEWLQRINRAGLHGIYAPRVFLFVQEGGVSSNWRESMREQKAIMVRYSRKPLLAHIISCILSYRTRFRIFFAKFLPLIFIKVFQKGKSLR
jgi:glycosyltransferase involved in cell wall biosynthesis